MNYKIPLSKPDITGKERKYVLEVLKTPTLALGEKYLEFQKMIAEFAGVKYAVAVNSGTSGLHLIIKALGIGEGDEVITTPFSFIASSNCILYERAKPVFVDIDKNTLNIDVSKIEEKITKKTKAILAVDVFSQPADWNELDKIAKKYKLHLIEDSAEALGSEYRGKRCGSFGSAAVFAFYPNKVITTAEGGMIVTNDKKIADLCKSFANQGRKPHEEKWLDHVRIGYNYRLDEMSCALGIAQMERIREILAKRRRVAQLYSQKLKESFGTAQDKLRYIEIPYIKPGNKLSWFVYVVKLTDRLKTKRDKIIESMEKSGIQCGYYFKPIHLQFFYRESFGYKLLDFPITENISQRTIALPFFNDLTEKQINFIVKNLREIIKKFNQT